MKKIILICKITFILMLLNSCGKYLNLRPENNTFDEVFWKDAKNISSATAGGYDLLRNALRLDRSFFIFGDIAAGNFSPEADNDFNSVFSRGGGYNFGFVYPYLRNALWNWSRFYKIINQCNIIIENTATIPNQKFTNGEKEKVGYIAQARFLRAYTNFYMQRIWGDIILVKSTYADLKNIKPSARYPQDVTLQFCVDDLLYAIDHLENNGIAAFASKGAAQALLAHVYAWLHDYPNAELMATAVINTSGHQLEDINTYKNIWVGKSNEVIFEIPMLYGTSGNEFSDAFFNWFLAAPDIVGKSVNSTWPMDEFLLSTYFDQSDDRLDKIKGANNLLSKYNNVIYYDTSNPSRYAVSNNLVLLRLADIYLLRAEAYAKNHKEDLAIADLNLIRNRAGLTSITAAGENLFIEIFRERRRELIGEGSTQFDLIRMELLGKLAEYSVFYNQDRINNQGYYWPLDMELLLPQNLLLTQNPWWKTNF